MSKPYYVLHPGYITDGQGNRIYVQASELLRLYKVDVMSQFTVHLGDTSGNPHGQKERFIRWPDDAIHLHPREDGLYDLT
jgi:hypothetical protein